MQIVQMAADFLNFGSINCMEEVYWDWNWCSSI